MKEPWRASATPQNTPKPLRRDPGELAAAALSEAPVAERLNVVPAPKAVLLTGVYGSGKSSVCEEIAELLEEAGTAYGAIDLDWLWWFHVFGLADDEHDRVGLSNLLAVVGNYLSAGVDHFVLAGFVGSAAALAAFRAALPFPIRVVRLTLPYEEIGVRLSSAVTAGRAKDLQEARLQSERVDAEIGDLVVANDRPIREVADEILAWLNWR